MRVREEGYRAKGCPDTDEGRVAGCGEGGGDGGSVDHGVGDGARDRDTGGADAEAGCRCHGELHVETADNDANAMGGGAMERWRGGGQSGQKAACQRDAGLCSTCHSDGAVAVHEQV